MKLTPEEKKVIIGLRDEAEERKALARKIEKCTHDWKFSWEEYHGSCTEHYKCSKCGYELSEHFYRKCKKGFRK